MRKIVPFAVLAVLVAAAGCSETSQTPTSLREMPAAAITVDPSPTGATVDTDKEDYAPGEVVTIIGTGWAPGETIHLHLTEEPAADGPHDWDVVANTSGDFTDTSFSPGMQHFGVTFTLTATGETSGTSTAVFTDGGVAFQLATADNAAPSNLAWQVSWRSYQGSSPSPNNDCTGGGTAGGASLTGNTLNSGSSVPNVNANGSLSVEGATASGYVLDYWSVSASSTTPWTPACIPGTSGGASTLIITLYAHFKAVVVDVTSPVIVPTIVGTLGNNGWYTSDVTVSWSVTDGESAIGSTTGCGPTTISTDTNGQTLTCTATSAGGTNMQSVTIKRDATAPTASASAAPAPNANGWNNTDVTVSFSGTDALSGIDTCSTDVTLSTEGAGQSASGTCTDNAGNVSASASASDINIDKTSPSVSLVGGPSDGASYYFGSVPAAPTCTPSDALSGIDGSCSVSGHGSTVGTHTIMATANDKAGNTTTESVTYEVLAWTTSGFYQPVNMDPYVFNTVKSGSTVPLKFELFAGPTELTSTGSIKSFQQQVIACPSAADITEDVVDVTTTGGTTLRYDTTDGQFVQNWQTPKNKAGTCYRVTMTAQDGSTIKANFKLK